MENEKIVNLERSKKMMEAYAITTGDISSFLDYLKREERSRATVEKYQRDLMKFYVWMPEGKVLSKEVIISYKQQLIAEYSPVSINSMLAAVNSFLKFMELDYMRVRPLQIQRKIFCEAAKELTKEEYYRLLRAAAVKKNQRINMIMQTICATGIRISELKHFTAESVTKGRVQVYSKKKVRTVLIPELLRKKLQVYIHKQKIRSGSIFVTRNGMPVNRSNVWAEMKAVCSAAGVEPGKVFPHNLRHLFARTYYSMKKDITRLADILGHSSIETTRIYTISTGAEHERQIAGLGLIM